MKNKTLRIFLISLCYVISLGIFTAPSQALPEYVRFGYFGCQSCHASPSGGGLLTPYGRSVAAERVSTWSSEGEEQPLHNTKGTPPEWFLAGGNFRQIQTYVDNERIKEGRYFTMQGDLEAGINWKALWIAGSFGKETSAYPKEDGTYRNISRRHFVRVDLGETVIARYGKFFPRFGLMIPHHNAGIRKGMGFDQGSETNNAELTWSSETIEVTATAVVAPMTRSQVEGPYANDRGAYGSASYFLWEKSRIGLSSGRIQKADALVLKDSIFAVGSFDANWFGLAEFSRQRLLSKNAQVDSDQSTFTYVRISNELVRGLAPYVLHESKIPSYLDDQTRATSLALGAIWTPRPHFELEANGGVSLKPKEYRYTNVGYLLFHYYL